MLSRLFSYSVVAAFLSLNLNSIAHAGAGSGGGGDAKAIEFLSYAKFACTWMSTNNELQQYADLCNSNVNDVRASLGDYKRTARLEFTPENLKDQNGISKPAITTPEGRIRVNRDIWISMSLTERAKTAAMEMSVICQIDDRYNVGDKIGGIWELAHAGARPLRELPVGTRILGYSPITIPANTNTLGFPTITSDKTISFSEVYAGDEGSFEEQIQGSSVKNIYGRVYSFGTNQLVPFTPEDYCRTSSKKEYEKYCVPEFNQLTPTDHLTGSAGFDLNWQDNSSRPSTEGALIIMPDVQKQDVTIQNLTINSVETVENLGSIGETYRGKNESGGGWYDWAVVLDASTDLNPDKVVKIVVYANTDPTLGLLTKEFQRHFAIVFPEPKAE
jgi:hypothetical protein